MKNVSETSTKGTQADYFCLLQPILSFRTELSFSDPSPTPQLNYGDYMNAILFFLCRSRSTQNA